MRFLHTADWQLGMTRHFLDTDAQARFSSARLDAVREIGRIAAAEECEFVLVCGDVFESNLLGPQVIGRALEVMRGIPVPVLLLPGNHDPVDAASIYSSPEFVRGKPDNVRVLAEPGLHQIRPGVELVAAPWDSKRPLTDLAGQQCAALPPADGTVRVLAAHGAVDALNPDQANPALIRLGSLRDAIADGRLHYVGLGDRHSRTKVDERGAVWYSGTPEVTAFDECDPGHVLVVDVDAEGVDVRPHRVGRWRFVLETRQLDGPSDIAAFRDWLDNQPDKDRSVLKLGLEGAVTVRDKAELDGLLDAFAPLFAAIQLSERRSDLVVRPDDEDFTDMGLSGFADSALAELREVAARGDAEAEVAQDALGLLYRLVRSPR
jgi:DNA repair exonuclease SbcCD nuclease subunit